MKRYIQLIILFLSFISSMLSQDLPFQIRGIVVDSSTNLPLSGVSVQIKGSHIGTNTDSNGVFSLSLKEKNDILLFSFLGYHNKFLKVNYKLHNTIMIELSEDLQLLNEVTISASNLEGIIQKKKNNVLDYEFSGNNILLITYSNDLSRSNLILMGPSFDTLSRIDIPQTPIRFFKDCLGNRHMLCKDSTYQIFADSVYIKLYPAEPIQNFEKVLFPCVAEDSQNLYFMQKSGSIPIETDFHVFNSANNIVDYTFVNKFTKQRSSLISIVDEDIIKKRQEEYEYEMKKLKAGMYTTGSPAQDQLFFETTMIKEVYAPLYSINDTNYVFDFVNAKLLSFNNAGKPINKIDINFQNQKYWRGQLFLDEISRQVFAGYEENGITLLKKIDLRTGKLTSSCKIPYTNPINIKVHDNHIYFIHLTSGLRHARCLSRIGLN